MGPGEFFGELALLVATSVAQTKATTDCTLAILNRRDVLQFLDRNPGMVRFCANGSAAPPCRSLRWRSLSYRSGSQDASAINRDRLWRGWTHQVPARTGQHRWRHAREREQVHARMAAQRYDQIDGNSIAILDRASLQTIADAVED
jgi:CRP-like cAMP-binding protein